VRGSYGTKPSSYSPTQHVIVDSEFAINLDPSQNNGYKFLGSFSSLQEGCKVRKQSYLSLEVDWPTEYGLSAFEWARADSSSTLNRLSGSDPQPK
jgi:hypothetical protein